jgi:type I restriction enzyme M protein
VAGSLEARLAQRTLVPRDFHEYVRGKVVPPIKGRVIGSLFEIHYGQHELEIKDRLAPGDTPVISSSGEDNGCHGFYDFDWVIAPPFVTVPRTGSIGRAHVQDRPCGASSDNLLLIPRDGVGIEMLYIAAAIVRHERWRFNYGNKMTPGRIAGFPIPKVGGAMKQDILSQLARANRIEAAALSPS